MALDKNSLARLGSVPYAAADAVSLFLYATNDTVTQCIASGYFNGSTKTLRKGDLILISAVNGGTPTCSLCVVTSADNAATVTTAAAVFT
ncbi:hypothetical protein [Bradyrhizobium elkanii]|uniref:Uncharacterized protein n=1 Tax=Bradyrhizobium elkanii TaxID=29448 RepID=A0A8I2C6X2_BRAEL|nr:hypothetical protein [Bradyrhizobium elkanii]MBP1296618.1 hypothetical protein [Bradyrhizobium elkanii]